MAHKDSYDNGGGKDKQPWGIKQTTPSSMKTRDKFEAFDQGNKKVLTKKEQEELRKRQEEEAAKAVLQEFVATFDSNGKGGPKMFVKGDTINPPASEAERSPSDKLYKPALKLLAKSGGKSSSNPFSDDQSSSAAAQQESERQAKKRTEEKKKSNLELFKEELKRMQMEREERHKKRQGNKEEDTVAAATRPEKSAFDNESSQEPSTPSLSTSQSNFVSSGPGKQPHSVDDPNTTNIFISNLSPKTVEQDLIKRFGKYGLLGSVKIMWPRSEEEKARSANCGFVAFMTRRDAEIAIKELDGSMENGQLMRLSWSKAVVIPTQPIYIPPELVDVIIPPPPSGLPFNAQPQSAEQMKRIKKKAKKLLDKYKKEHKRRRSHSSSDSDSSSSSSSMFSSSSSSSSGSSRSRSSSSSSSSRSSSSERETTTSKSKKFAESDFTKTLQNAVVKVVIPTERTLLCLIHKTVEFVAKYGPEFEAALMAREASNPLYRFLFDYQSPSHGYYRWKLYSVLHGESVYRWNTLPFQMFAEGSYWQPPPLNRFTRGCDNDESFKRVKRELVAKMGNKLANDKRDSLNELISGLTIERKSIADAMVFCIDNAEKSEQIIESLIEAIVPGTDTPLNKIVARFYLLSDILHNCCVKVANASNYRRSIERHLVSVFENANKIWNSIDGKLKSESFKQRILSCVRAWEDWAIYPSEFLVRLQNTFLGLASESAKRENNGHHHQRPAPKPIVDVDVGEDEDEDVDGKPLEEAETSESSASASKKGTSESSKFVSSKWEQVDPDMVDRQAITTSKWDFYDEQEQSKSSLKNLTSYEDDEEDEGEEWSASRQEDTSKNNDDDDDDEDIDGKPLDDDEEDESKHSSSSASRSPQSKYLPNHRHDSSSSKKTRYT